MSKDSFYALLCAKNCPMVVHLKDQPHTTPLDLLKALLEHAENDVLMRTCYPQSMLVRPNPLPKPVECYHHQASANKRADGYTLCLTQLDAKPKEVVPEPTLTATFLKDDDILERWYSDGFLIRLRQATEISEYCNGKCFNCKKEGHHWHQCQEPLSLELQELAEKHDKEHKECEQRALNHWGALEWREAMPLHLQQEPTQPPPGGWSTSSMKHHTVQWLSLQILEWRCPVLMAGSGEPWLAILDGVHTSMLVNNGAKVNSVMPAYVCEHKLGCGPSPSWISPSTHLETAFH